MIFMSWSAADGLRRGHRGQVGWIWRKLNMFEYLLENTDVRNSYNVTALLKVNLTFPIIQSLT